MKRWLILMCLGLISLSACKPKQSSQLASVDSNALVKLGFVQIKSDLTGKVLDVRDQSMTRGAKIQQWSYATQSNQQWIWNPQAGGTFTIRVKHSDKCLDLQGFNPDDGAPVSQWDCNGKINQQWRLVERGQAFEIRSAFNDKCLDVLGFKTENGADIGVWTCKQATNQLWVIGSPEQSRSIVQAIQQSSPSKLPIDLKNYPFEQIIGTQIIGPAYHFTQDDPVLEGAKEIFRMGSRMIKLRVKDDDAFRQILNMDFNSYFFWYRSSSSWFDGFSAQEQKEEYEATYAFAKKLLTDYADSSKTFFVGHWEGDWYLLPDYNTANDAPELAIQGMISWLNTRQKAIDDARRDVSNSQARIFNYTEVNRVQDAMLQGKRRLVNAVLPKTQVDYVSYSSYDVQQAPEAQVSATLDYINSQLAPKPSITGKRVFIGEFGIAASKVGFNSTEHERINAEIMGKFLKWGTPYILYWAMYNNEVKDGQQVGFWLIDDKNNKLPLYFTLQKLFNAQNSFVSDRLQDQKAMPTCDEMKSFALQWLKGR